MAEPVTECGAVSVPINPFVSNRYHFGMLLGVADLESDQGYHRGKAWLQSAWLHGEGAVWGLAVDVRPEAGEVGIDPGLAYDRNGRELRVTNRLCLDLGRWFAERRPDDLEVEELPGGEVRFVVHVRLCAEHCLDRPVPSISEPCDGSDLDTAYSRTVELAAADLAAGPAPAPPLDYPRLRQFAGQLPAEDAAVVDALAAVEAADPADRPATCLGWFRRLAALDALDLEPEGGPGALFPAEGDACIALADLAAHLRPDGDRWVVVGDGPTPSTVDNTVRPAHVRTRTVQELLCGPVGGPLAPAGPPDPAPRRTRAAGRRRGRGGAPPRAVSGSAALAGRALRVGFTAPLDAATVGPDQFAVTVLRATGWRAVAVERVELDEPGTGATLRLRTAPRARPLRVVARGAGSTPLLGTDGRPLSGVDIDDRTVSSGEDAALTVTDTE